MRGGAREGKGTGTCQPPARAQNAKYFALDCFAFERHTIQIFCISSKILCIQPSKYKIPYIPRIQNLLHFNTVRSKSFAFDRHTAKIFTFRPRYLNSILRIKGNVKEVSTEESEEGPIESKRFWTCGSGECKRLNAKDFGEPRAGQ